MNDERRARAARQRSLAGASPIGAGAVDGVRRWTVGLTDQATVLFDIGARVVRVRAERIRGGRWLAWLDGRFEDGESTGDEVLDAELRWRACRALRLRAEADERLDDVCGCVSVSSGSRAHG